MPLTFDILVLLTKSGERVSSSLHSAAAAGQKLIWHMWKVLFGEILYHVIKKAEPGLTPGPRQP